MTAVLARYRKILSIVIGDVAELRQLSCSCSSLTQPPTPDGKFEGHVIEIKTYQLYDMDYQYNTLINPLWPPWQFERRGWPYGIIHQQNWNPCAPSCVCKRLVSHTHQPDHPGETALPTFTHANLADTTTKKQTKFQRYRT